MHEDDEPIWDEPAFVAAVLATLSVTRLVGWIGAIALTAEQRYDATTVTLVLLGRETAAFLTLDFLTKRYLGITWAGLGLRRVQWGQVAVGAVLGLVVMVLSALLLTALDLRGDARVFRAAATGTLGWQLALFAVVAVYSPVVQELVFRGLLLQGLLQRTNVAVAVGVSSAAFALLHATNGTASVVDTFVFGILQGALFVRFRSLTAPIASHIAVNSFIMLHMIYTLHQRSGPFSGVVPW